MAVDLDALTDTLNEQVAEFNWGQGFARGVVAFFAGWASLVVLSYVAPGGNQGPLLGQLVLLGLLFYGFQFVPLRTANHFQPWLSGDPIDPVSRLQPTIPKVVYYLLPVVVVGLLGAELGYRVADGDHPAINSFVCGLSMATGYLAMAVLFVFVLSQPTNLGGIARPDLLWAVAMGIEYPVVFGTLGAYVGHSYRLRGPSGAGAEEPA